MPSNVQPSNGFEFPHSSLVDQLCATAINCVAKSNNPVSHAPNIHPNVFDSFHRTFTHGESHRIFTNSSPSNDVSLHFTIEPLPSTTYPFSFIRTLKTIEKQIHILLSCETIRDCQIWTLTCYPLGHQYKFGLINLKHYIPNIKPLSWNPADISLPWSNSA